MSKSFWPISTMSFPVALSGLTPREAITDSLYRCVLGMDINDVALFDSAFTLDSSFDLNGTVLEGLDNIHTKCYDLIAKLDTTHIISNIRIDLKDGESKASLTASAVGQHYRQGQGKESGATQLLSGGLYYLDLIKDEGDGLWKITHWKLKSTWFNGDLGVMTGN